MLSSNCVRLNTSYANCDVQFGQRLAASGMSVQHCGQGFVVGDVVAGFLRSSRWMVLIRKNITRVTSAKAITLLMNMP